MKVDRVASAAEAALLESSGAGIIGVDLDPNPRFADDRTVRAETVADIRRTLTRAQLAVALDLHDEPARVVHRAQRTGADLVQPITSAVPPHPVRLALRDAGLSIVYAGIEISHDDDPAWIFSAHDAAPDLRAAFFQVSLLPEYENSWEFLRDSSPEYPEEFQIEDLDQLAAERPLIASFDITPDSLREIETKVPNLRGLAFVLADGPEPRSGVRSHSLPAVLGALQAVRR